MTPKLWYLLTLGGLLYVSLYVHGADRERELRRGHFTRRGNERSERPPTNTVTPGQPVFGGNGCPAGTMRVVFAPDALSFTVLFDEFAAEVGSGGPKRDVMACDTLIPIQLPPGMQMQITRVDFRGFAGLPDAGSRGALHSVLNFRGAGGDGTRINLRYRFEAPQMDNYEISTDAMNDGPSAAETSPCGGLTRLRIFNQLRVTSKTNNGIITLDSIDGGAHAIYYVNWRTCSRGKRG